MQSAWIDRDADAAVARYEKLGRDVALRVYTCLLYTSSGFRKIRIFLQMGLDDPNHVDPAGDFSFAATPDLHLVCRRK